MTSSMKTSYNILITTTGLSSVGQGGGISSYVQALATGLVSAGHHVTVYLVREGKEVFPHKTNYNYSFFHIPAEYRQGKLLSWIPSGLLPLILSSTMMFPICPAYGRF